MDPAKQAALTALRCVQDPEVGLDVVAMGLIYGLEVTPEEIAVFMTLTSRGCPLGETLTGMAREALEGIAGPRRVRLDLAWEPPWSPEMISEDGRRALRG